MRLLTLLSTLLLLALTIAPAQAQRAIQGADDDRPAVETMASPSSEKRATCGDLEAGKSESDADWALVRLTAALVLVGLLQFGTYVGQACIMRKTLRVSDRNAEEAKRLEQPWLTPLPALPKPVSEREIAYRFRVRLVNYGRTPAWITSRKLTLVRVTNGEIPSDEPEGFLAGAIAHSEIVVAPKRRFTDYEIAELADADKAALMSGTLTFLLHGEIEYRDIFNATHRAGFAWFVTKWHPGFKKDAPWAEWLWGFRRGPNEYWTDS